MYCKYCGTKINDDSQFCYSCGSKIKEANTAKTDYSSVTGTVDPNQYYNGYNQGNYAQEPLDIPEVVELKENIFSNGLISTIFANLPVPFIGIVGIIFGRMTDKKVKKLKDMGYRLKGKTKAGEILGKAGFFLSIGMTAFWVLYFSLIVIFILIAIIIGNGF